MERFALLSSRNLPPGERILGPIVVPVGVVAYKIWFERENWPVHPDQGPGEDDDAISVVEFLPWISYDAGVTWGPLSGGGSHGGIHINARSQAVSQFCTSKVSLLQPLNPDRRLRVWLRVIEALRTTINIDVLIAADL